MAKQRPRYEQNFAALVATCPSLLISHLSQGKKNPKKPKNPGDFSGQAASFPMKGAICTKDFLSKQPRLPRQGCDRFLGMGVLQDSTLLKTKCFL